MNEQQDQIRITARPQVNPLKCDFEVDRTIVDGTAYFGDASSAADSPLAATLFALEGVEQVLMRGTGVSVTRSATTEWQVLAKHVGAAIRTHLQSGDPVVSENALAGGGSDDQRIRNEIDAILESEINPAIASHGGVITVLDVKGGIVYVKMGGGCQGCASSTATLKQGVEEAIRTRVSGVVDILDTTDHAAGTNPYYSPAY